MKDTQEPELAPDHALDNLSRVFELATGLPALFLGVDDSGRGSALCYSAMSPSMPKRGLLFLLLHVLALVKEEIDLEAFPEVREAIAAVDRSISGGGAQLDS